MSILKKALEARPGPIVAIEIPGYGRMIAKYDGLTDEQCEKRAEVGKTFREIRNGLCVGEESSCVCEDCT